MKENLIMLIVATVIMALVIGVEGFVGRGTLSMPYRHTSIVSSTNIAAAVPTTSGRRPTTIARMIHKEQAGGVRMTAAVIDGSKGKVDNLAYDLDSWKKGYQTADSEDQYLMEATMGSIPEDIEGTLFRIVPAKFEIGEDTVMHPFDADGMAVAVSFSKEGAYLRNRYVKTKGYMKELKAGKRLYRGFSNIPGGPLKNAFRLKSKNLANTNILHWGGYLLAMWEGGLPYRLDAKSLETYGETSLGETIDENSNVFTAHPKIDTKAGRLVGFGNVNMKQITYYEYDDKFRLRDFRILKEVSGFLHDFCVTEKYSIFFSGPVGVNPLMWVLGLKSIGAMLTWEGDRRDAVIHIVPRDPSKPLKSIPVPAKFCFHLANAYDDPTTGEVVFDSIERDCLQLEPSRNDENVSVWENISFETEIAQPRLVRYRLDLSGDDAKVVRTEDLYSAQIEFPSVNPKVYCQEHRYVFAQCGILEDDGGCPGQGVMKLNTVDGTVDKWLPEAHEFATEPTFVPRKGAPENAPEDFGYLATFVVNGRDRVTELVILDAQKISKGPVCRLPLKGFIPHTLHGSFAPELVFTPEQVEKSFALSDLFDRKGWNVAKSEFSGLGLNSLMD